MPSFFEKAKSLSRSVLIIGASALAFPFTCLFFILYFAWGKGIYPRLRRRWLRFQDYSHQKYQNLLWSTPKRFRRFKGAVKGKRLLGSRRNKQKEQSSPLVRLPLELQLQIWRMVYEDTTIHLVAHGTSVGHFLCPEEPALRQGGVLDEPRYFQCRCRGSALAPRAAAPPRSEALKRSREKQPLEKSLLRVSGLHLTCREMYVTMPYSRVVRTCRHCIGNKYMLVTS